jgi:hypothetical protein
VEGESGLDSPSVKTFAEWAEELCPYYMALGVSCHDYWHGDYSMLRYYELAHDRQMEQRNSELWLQGLYIFKAVDTAIINRFCKKKGEALERYLDKPIRITPLTEEEKREAAEKERQKIIASFTAWGEAWKNKAK